MTGATWRASVFVGGALAFALLTRLLIQHVAPETGPATTFLVAIAGASVLYGWKAGGCALALSLGVMWFVVVDPMFSFSVAERADIANLIILIALGLLLVWLGEYTHTLKRRAADNAQAWCKVVQSIPVPVAVRDEEGRFLVVSDGWMESTGFSRDQIRTLGDWLALAHSGAEAEAAKRIPAPSANYPHRTEKPLRIKTSTGKTLRWDMIRIRMPGLLDPTPHMMVVAIDRTEEHERQAQFQLVVRELNHRLRNMLTVIRSTVLQALKMSATIEEAKHRVSDQIDALVAAYNLMMDREDDVSLHDLVALEANGLSRTDKLRILGEEVMVSSQSALPLALIVHELATNAAKYGAWSNDQGEVLFDVHRAGGKVRLRWGETSGPSCTPPSREGFGSHLIGKAVRALGGSVKFTPAKGGYVYEFAFKELSLCPTRANPSRNKPEATGAGAGRSAHEERAVSEV